MSNRDEMSFCVLLRKQTHDLGESYIYILRLCVFIRVTVVIQFEKRLKENDTFQTLVLDIRCDSALKLLNAHDLQQF